MKTRVSLKYFVHDCIWKHFFASNLPQTLLNLLCLTLLGTLRPLTQFLSKISATAFQKSVKFVILDNYFSDLFT